MLFLRIGKGRALLKVRKYRLAAFILGLPTELIPPLISTGVKEGVRTTLLIRSKRDQLIQKRCGA